MLEGRILITGGAGFIARAIYRRAEREGWPAKFIAFSRDDAKLANVVRRYPGVSIVRGDITRDPEILRAAMAGADFVIHAAAAKYVDLSEHNAFDTVAVNVDGSRQVAVAACDAGVERVVGISTDKACQPVNVYGMTKAVMERLFTEADTWTVETEFTCVRYGNVIGSTGSVIPLFRQQLADFGHVKVTDPNMTRFWMAPDDAVDFIVYALTEASRGSIVTRWPLAAKMQAVVEAAVGAAAPVEYIGLRPGEKMHEDLVHIQESVRVKSRRVAGDVEWFEVRPPGEIVDSHEWQLTSEAPGRWIGAEEIRRIADDAATI